MKLDAVEGDPKVVDVGSKVVVAHVRLESPCEEKSASRVVDDGKVVDDGAGVSRLISEAVTRLIKIGRLVTFKGPIVTRPNVRELGRAVVDVVVTTSSSSRDGSTSTSRSSICLF